AVGGLPDALVRARLEPHARERGARALPEITAAPQFGERIPARARPAEEREHRVLRQRVAGEEGDDLVGARHAEVREAVGPRAGHVLPEEPDGAAIAADLAADEVEERGLARAVRAEEQTALTLVDGDAHPADGGDAAERLPQIADLEGERHSRRSPG